MYACRWYYRHAWSSDNHAVCLNNVFICCLTWYRWILDEEKVEEDVEGAFCPDWKTSFCLGIKSLGCGSFWVYTYRISPTWLPTPKSICSFFLFPARAAQNACELHFELLIVLTYFVNILNIKLRVLWNENALYRDAHVYCSSIPTAFCRIVDARWVSRARLSVCLRVNGSLLW